MEPYTADKIARFEYQLKSDDVSPAANQIVSTVRAVHRARIMNTLDVHKTAELVMYALQHGLINPL